MADFLFFRRSCDEPLHRTHSRSRDPGFPRQPHTGNAGKAGGRLARRRRCAVRCLDRRARGRRAARRRPCALRRQGRPARAGARQQRDIRAAAGIRRAAAGPARSGHARTGRHGEQIEAWRKRHSLRLARGGPRRGGERGTASLAVSRRSERLYAPCSADERAQRRRTRGQPARHSGVHARPRRRGHLPRRAAHGRGNLSRARLARRSLRRGRRGWLRPLACKPRGGARPALPRH